MKYWHGWLLLKSCFQAFSVITSHVNISCREQFFGQPKVQEAYNIIIFWFLMENSILKIFGSVDVKKSPLTSVHNYNQLPEGGLTFKPSGRGSVTTAAVVLVSFLKEPVNIKKSRISPWYKRIRKAAVVHGNVWLSWNWDGILVRYMSQFWTGETLPHQKQENSFWPANFCYFVTETVLVFKNSSQG